MLTIVTAEPSRTAWNDSSAKPAPRSREYQDTGAGISDQSDAGPAASDRLGAVKGILVAVCGAAVFWACAWYVVSVIF